jgi:hypothetical protein
MCVIREMTIDDLSETVPENVSSLWYDLMAGLSMFSDAIQQNLSRFTGSSSVIPSPIHDVTSPLIVSWPFFICGL